MRRLNDERGAIAVIVAVSLVALFGMGAVVIDVAAMFQERRELQNGADAAALAIAEGCVRQPATCALSLVSSTAQTYLDANALDGTSTLAGIDLDLVNRRVTVTASTRRPGGATSILFWFARVLSDEYDGATITASATATWGGPSSMRVGPLAVEECDFSKAPLGVPRKITFHGGGTGSSCANPTPSSSGQDYAGGFGYLRGADGCWITVSTGSIPGNTGNDPPKDTECTAAQLQALIGTTIPIPIFTTVTDSGSNAIYSIVGFGAFVLTEYELQPGGGGGWRTGPNVCRDRAGDLPEDLIGHAPSARCIRGHFTELITVDALAGSGPGYGTTTFSLSG